MKVVSIQLAVPGKDKAAAIDRAVKKVRQCQGADLVILPEIWNIGFMRFDRYETESETARGPTLSAIREVARCIRAHVHAGSFVEKHAGCFYNTSFLISPAGVILGRYRKIHLFGYDSDESKILTPGDRVTVVNTSLGCMGMATCFDLRFPELFRAMVDQGARIFLVCSAWPYPRLEHWCLLNQVRALENQAFLISANSAGMDQGVQFAGHSMVVDPWGIPVAAAGDRETLVSTRIDPADADTARKTFPALAGRTPWLNL
jgi:predicted amidohydrolase